MQCSSKSAININKRRTDLLELSSYIQTVDNDVTMILQSLQWDRKHLIEASTMVSCKYDKNHRVPPDKVNGHEKECYLRSLGYSEEDLLLPEPLDANASTLVTLNKNDIQNIIDYAAKVDPTFKKGRGSKDANEPLSLERLQHTYSADERRALHDAVVGAAPSCHDLSGLALLSGDDKSQSTKPKSRAEIIAELRDMKRRRAKYRGAAKTSNYSDELRSVIATQMEHYSEALGVGSNNDPINKSNTERSKDFRPIQVKKEPIAYDQTYATGNENRRTHSREHDRHREESRGETRQRDRSKDKNRRETHKRDKSEDENRRYKKDAFRHKDYRDDHHPDRKEKNTDREKAYDDYKRDRNDKRHKDDRVDRYSSKERGRYKNAYKNHDKYRDDYYKDKSSSNSQGRYKDGHDSRDRYKQEKHKTYYDYNQDYEVDKKRIKQEKE